MILLLGTRVPDVGAIEAEKFGFGHLNSECRNKPGEGWQGFEGCAEGEDLFLIGTIHLRQDSEDIGRGEGREGVWRRFFGFVRLWGLSNCPGH